MNDLQQPTYEELKAKCDDYPSQIIRSLVVKQDLIDTRNKLDRDLERFQAIQSYSRRAIQASSFPELGEITVESIVEAFQVECSAIFLANKNSSRIRLLAGFGFDFPETGVDVDVASTKETRASSPGARIESVADDNRPWADLGLSQVITSSFYDSTGNLAGVLAGGISKAKSPYYEELTEEMIPSFVVLTQQMSSVFHNLESQEQIKAHLRELREGNESLQLAQEQLRTTNVGLTRTINELSSLHDIGTAITSILDQDQLVTTVLRTIVERLRYDRALILLVDEDREVLTHGRVEGASEEMTRYVENLEVPIERDTSALGRAAATGTLVFVPNVGRAEIPVNLDITTILETDSFVVIPLKVKQKTIGVLAVDNYRSKAELTEGDVNLVSTLAGQVAISIDNARLYDDMRALNVDLEAEISERVHAEAALRKARDELEQRVVERTAELSDANILLKQEVDERKRVELELQKAKESAENANRAKSDFLANMSHELRTPMNAVIGFSEMIIDGIYGEAPEEIAGAVQEIQSSGEHLLKLINDVLDISKIEAGRMELKITDNAPEECVESVTGRMASLASEKGLDIKTEVREELPTTAFDFQRILQVLMNLVGNAIKFTRSGEIRIGVQANDDAIVFWVSDTGIGIPNDELENIFAEFLQADSSISREVQGSGLGLAISKRFVEMHGGRIWVESVVGVGSTFRFSLPLRRST